MTVTIAALTQIGAQTGPNVNASLFDANWAAIRDPINGLVYTSAEVDALLAALRVNPRAYLAGYGLSNNGSDATNDIDIAVGTCRDSTNAKDLTLASALTKQTDAAWAVGTNQGGLDIGSVANRTYHTYSILRSDTGVVDALFSCNPGRAATITMTIASPAVVTWTNHGLQAGSTVVFTTTGALPTGITAGTRYYVISAGLTADAFEVAATDGGAAINTSGSQSGTHTGTANPVMPTSYDYFRRIGSIIRSGGAIVAFTQDGDYFIRSTVPLDVDANNPGAAAVMRTLSIPVGHNVFAIFNATLLQSVAAGTSAYFSDPATTDVAASTSAAPLAQITVDTTVSLRSSWSGPVRTNTAGQIRSRLSASDANTTLRIATLGWIDRRGRDS